MNTQKTYKVTVQMELLVPRDADLSPADIQELVEEHLFEYEGRLDSGAVITSADATATACSCDECTNEEAAITAGIALIESRFAGHWPQHTNDPYPTMKDILMDWADAVANEDEDTKVALAIEAFEVVNAITAARELVCLVCGQKGDECDGTCDWCDNNATTFENGCHYCSDCLDEDDDEECCGTPAPESIAFEKAQFSSITVARCTACSFQAVAWQCGCELAHDCEGAAQ
jgi:hypothetical protein